MEKVAVVTRSFQSGAAFYQSLFDEKVAVPIRKLLRYDDVVEGLVVVVNGEAGNPLAEVVDVEGESSTTRALKHAFAQEYAQGRLQIILARQWGSNPGSATALNAGVDFAKQQWEAQWILAWSTEIALNGYRIAEALNAAHRHDLAVVGFLRERWWEKPQWIVAQNTATLWRTGLLSKLNGFDPACNGDERMLEVPDFGKVPLAGMEDFHALLRIMAQTLESGRPFRWGMSGKSAPLRWDTSFTPGSQRARLHAQKVARQYLVMEAWAKQLFPQHSFAQVLEMLFARLHIE